MLPTRHARLALAALFACAATPALAAVKLGSPFVAHAVLQRDKPIPVWGTADAGADVTVTLGDRHATAKADADGKWSVSLDAMPVTTKPVTLTAAAGSDTAAADDLLVGDVFLCSGQSNMQFSLKELADAEAIAPAPLPLLRLGKVALNGGKEPKDHCDVKWTADAAKSAADFPAVAYCFARQLYATDPKLTGVPVGLLSDCMGATVIESWMPKPTLAEFDAKSLQSSMFGIGPTQLYNGMIAPLRNLPMAGVIWYQGEGNAGEPARYQKYIPLWVKAWRDQFQQPKLPFMIVQLPDYAPDWGGVYWPWIREAQAKGAAAVPDVYYCVSINTNDGWDLHPQGKREIGRRLAALARQAVYHEDVPGRSPACKSATPDGVAIRVVFDTDGSSLTSGSNAVEGFTLAGDNGVYHAATAHLDGPDAVVVRSAAVPAPKTVRYAWAGVPHSTLISAAGLPAAPFRTDDQPIEKGHAQTQQQPTGYVFKAKAYQVKIDGDGRATGLVVGYQQMLSNADGPWGGSNLAGPGGSRNLNKITPDGTDRLVCRGGDVSATLGFDDSALHWTIANAGKKDTVTFTLALSPLAKATAEGNSITVRRGPSTLTITGADELTEFHDPSADAGGHVVKLSIPPGQTKTLDVAVGK